MRSSRDSESQPSNADMLSKMLRRGSHATLDPADESRDTLPFGGDHLSIHSSNYSGGGGGGRSRQGSTTSNQHRHSASGSSASINSGYSGGAGGGNNSRFTSFFVDPFYHAITLGKAKDDASRSSFSSPSSENHHPSQGIAPLSKDETGRRQALMPLSFGEMHLAFDPYSGCEPEDTMDNNELETLLEQSEEAKGVASAVCEDDNEVDCRLSSDENQYSEEELGSGIEEGEDGELDFDPPNISVSVKKLMHKIQSMSAMASEPVDLPATSNQDEDVDSDDVDEDAATVNTVEDLESLIPETKINPTYVPSCFPEAELPQQLSASFRRLVINLKDDSERRYEVQPQHAFSARRRGNSCPVPVRSQLSPAAPPVETSRTPTAALGSDSSRRRKKNTLGRFAPRLFETLHLRRKRKTFLYTDEELESIEGARWKIVELAFRFGGKHRFYLVQAVNMFFPLVKYGRRGGPHPTRLHCNRCGTLQWQHKRGGLSEAVDLAHVLHVLDGRQTAVFRKYSTNAALEACSLSIIFSDRTLDLETQSSSHRDWLMSALRTLISYSRKQREAEQRAIAERAILPLDEQQFSEQFGNGFFAGITSPPTNIMLV